MTRTKINSLVEAEFIVLNSHFVMEMTRVTGSAGKFDCLVICLTFVLISHRDVMKLLRFSDFLTVIKKSLNLSLNFLLSMSKT